MSDAMKALSDVRHQLTYSTGYSGKQCYEMATQLGRVEKYIEQLRVENKLLKKQRKAGEL